ncbi:hypothetical protein UFOVP140_28 [uncultured Caudovirales phage]|uniref:Uncharacterized protein n=1 Tax=uncultured Caudovirales phage TaxID=2100421 RepID=A0A6J5LJ93_9CAUD|nr:hypothetical protein UFOVP140_28 [uncultured Caudovirales phage]
MKPLVRLSGAQMVCKHQDCVRCFSAFGAGLVLASRRDQSLPPSPELDVTILIPDQPRPTGCVFHLNKPPIPGLRVEGANLVVEGRRQIEPSDRSEQG